MEPYNCSVQGPPRRLNAPNRAPRAHLCGFHLRYLYSSYNSYQKLITFGLVIHVPENSAGLVDAAQMSTDSSARLSTALRSHQPFPIQKGVEEIGGAAAAAVAGLAGRKKVARWSKRAIS